MLEENLDRHCALGQRRLGIPTEEQIIVHQQKRWDLDFEIAVEKLCRESKVSCGWGACGNISVVSIIPICRAVACCFIAHSRPYRSCMLCMCRHRVYLPLSLAPCYCAQHHVLLCKHLMHRQAQCTHGCAVVGTTARDLDTIALQKPTHPQEILPCLWK